MPRLTRVDIYFAVTVPPGFRDSEQGRSILAGYRRRLVVHILIALGIVIGAGATWPHAALPLGLSWLLVGSYSAFFWARKAVKPFAAAPSTIREAELTERDER